MKDLTSSDVFVSDESDTEEKLSKLAASVASLDKTQRVKPATRKELSSEVSEFHLKRNDNSNSVNIKELVSVLGHKASHAAISKKLVAITKGKKTLPKPLEKNVAEKIKRTIGYENVKTQMNKWGGLVHRNRLLEHVTFPVQSSEIVVQDSSKFLSKFKFQTPLEKEVDMILNGNEDLKQNKDESDEDQFPLSLEEMIMKRKEMARMRARQSYREAKFNRQKKIKSKKFHRIQRKQKLKEQIKEFESLQKSDPEAALKKLDELEKTRAHERASLRHKNTGQWAKNQMIRAKYNVESRKILAEQLSVSKELTQKTKDVDSSDDEAGVEVNMEVSNDNPWSLQQSNEINDFVSGYRKFWESKQTKHKLDLIGDETEKNNEVIVDNGMIVVVPETSDVKGQSRPPTFEQTKEFSSGKSHPSDPKIVDIDSKGRNKKDVTKMKNSSNEVQPLLTKKRKPSGNDTLGGEENDRKEQDVQLKKTLKKNLASGKTSLSEHKKVNVDCEDVNKKEVSKMKNASDKVEPGSAKKRKLLKNETVASEERKEQNIQSKKTPKKSKGDKYHVYTSPASGVWTVMTSDSEENVECNDEPSSPESSKKSTKKLRKIKAEKKNVVKSAKQNPNDIGDLDIDELFADAEEKLLKNFKKKYSKFKNEISDISQVNVQTAGKEDDVVNDFRGSKTLRADEDVEIGDMPESTPEHLIPVESRLNLESSKTEIDPNKFMKISPKNLNSSIPDNITEGDEGLDDVEEDASRQMTIMEAFVDDDVIDEFKQMKNDEEKTTQEEEIDLTLPGWGEWAGTGIKPNKRRNRFRVKPIPLPPRKDRDLEDTIINEEENLQIKQHMVKEVPFPFTSQTAFESSIRAPIGREWVPESAHKKLILPNVITKLGTIIDPITDDVLLASETTKSVHFKGKTSNKK